MARQVGRSAFPKRSHGLIAGWRFAISEIPPLLLIRQPQLSLSGRLHLTCRTQRTDFARVESLMFMRVGTVAKEVNTTKKRRREKPQQF
jgi:hypothetical protein